MIRQWLKQNATYIDLLKNSLVPKTPRPTRCLKIPNRFCRVCGTRGSFASAGRPVRLLHTLSDPKERGDGEEVEDSPARTELFEVKGPGGSAFLIEVLHEDLEEVKADLAELKGNSFCFDKTTIEWFIIKCCLTAEPQQRAKDHGRLVRVHAISSGCEEVHELDDTGRYLFVNRVDRTTRARRILEKLGYRISAILYKFQARERIYLDNTAHRLCTDFVEAVKRLPKVISVTHNL